MTAIPTVRETDAVFSGPPERLDLFVTRTLADVSRARVQRLIREGGVRVGGLPAPARRTLRPGDRVSIRLPEFAAWPAAADTVPTLFEDDDLIVVDKPAGWVVHPAGPHRAGTLIQRLWPKLAAGWTGSGAGAAQRPGVVHRLDRGTSGVMVVAKTPEAARHLSAQFGARTVGKVYRAWVRGRVPAPEGRVRSMVGRSRTHPRRMSTAAPGRWSETDYRVLRHDPSADRTLLELRPRTGRTHQIRVQLAALGHPILGDGLYGSGGDRPLLHAHRLSFDHPRTGRRLEFESPPPPELT